MDEISAFSFPGDDAGEKSLHDEAIDRNNELNKDFITMSTIHAGKKISEMKESANKEIVWNLTEARREIAVLKEENERLKDKLSTVSGYVQDIQAELKDMTGLDGEEVKQEETVIGSEDENTEEDIKEDDLRKLYEEYRSFKVQEFLFRNGTDREKTALIQKFSPIVRKVERRNIKADLAKLKDCEEHEISLTAEEAIKGGKKYHFGPLDLSELPPNFNSVYLPEVVDGPLSLQGIVLLDTLSLPRVVDGFFNARDLKRVNEYKGKIEKIEGSMYIQSLNSPVGFPFPNELGDHSTIFVSTNSSDSELEELQRKNPGLKFKRIVEKIIIKSPYTTSPRSGGYDQNWLDS